MNEQPHPGHHDCLDDADIIHMQFAELVQEHPELHELGTRTPEGFIIIAFEAE